MSRFIIEGGYPLSGEINVQGSKNAVLPIIAASIISGEKCVINNCPKLCDVDETVEILNSLGCETVQSSGSLVIDSSKMSCCRICEQLMRQIRSSIIFLGAILARCGEAVVCMPGGCEIGLRPIDLHIKALKQLGVEIVEDGGYIFCKAPKACGGSVHLDFPSVGATENAMLFAVGIDGKTVISNAAREPEIVDLQSFLCHMGANVCGAGTDTIEIIGGKKLGSAEYSVMPDRIVAGTYLNCCASAGGKIALHKVNPKDMTSTIECLKGMGAKIECSKNDILFSAPKYLNSYGTIRTMPYPGFATDMQSPMLALGCIANGTGIVNETIFENRFRNVDELIKMGANIRVEGRCAITVGVNKLHGASVWANELRGGASLVIAALGADGTTIVNNIKYIDRGYESIEKNLSSCGAHIIRTDD